MIGILERIQVKTVQAVSFENLEFAFSRRKVGVITTACRMRRDSDDTETDVLLPETGFVDNNSLTSEGSTVSDWLNGANGWLVKDYDQAGNGYDMIQTDKTRQAKIANAGNWLGYIDYGAAASGSFYSCEKFCPQTSGSVYIKGQRISGGQAYFISSANPSSSNMTTLAIHAPAEIDPDSNMRVLSFNSSTDQIISNDYLTLGAYDLLTYKSDGSKYHFRLNKTEQTEVVHGGTNKGFWFGDHPTSFRMQKGGIYWNGYTVTASNQLEKEILGFNVFHSQAESLEIENTM